MTDLPHPNRKYPRANFLDYSGGCFFVTICIKDKKNLLGKIEEGVMHYSTIGEYADKCISEIPDHYPDAEILIHTVMPNHIHAIVRNGIGEISIPLKQVWSGRWRGGAPCAALRVCRSRVYVANNRTSRAPHQKLSAWQGIYLRCVSHHSRN